MESKKFAGYSTAAAVIFAAVFSVACAHKKPPEPHMLKVGVEHPDFPDTSFICAVGMERAEKTSLDAIAEAEGAARTEVGNRICATLHSEAKMFMSSIDKNGVLSDSKTYELEVKREGCYKEDTLMRPQGEPVYWEGVHRVYVCLNRKEAGTTLLDNVAREMSRYSEPADLAAAALEKGDLAGFATQYMVAKGQEDSLATLVKTAGLLRTLHGPSFAKVQSVLARAVTLQESAQRIRAALTLGINTDEVARQHQGTVESTFSASLQKLGIKVVGDGATCGTDPAAPSHVLHVGAEPACKEGSLVLSCTISFPVRLESCGSGGAHQGRLEAAGLRGKDNQFVEKRARARLWKSVTAEKVTDPLETFLSTEFPLERLAAAR